MIVVADAGPLIHLSLVRQLDLVPALFGRVLVPEKVYAEVVQDADLLPGSAELRNAHWIDRHREMPQGEVFEFGFPFRSSRGCWQRWERPPDPVLLHTVKLRFWARPGRAVAGKALSDQVE